MILSFFTLSPFIIKVDPLPTEVKEVIEMELDILIKNTGEKALVRKYWEILLSPLRLNLPQKWGELD